MIRVNQEPKYSRLKSFSECWIRILFVASTRKSFSSSNSVLTSSFTIEEMKLRGINHRLKRNDFPSDLPGPLNMFGYLNSNWYVWEKCHVGFFAVGNFSNSSLSSTFPRVLVDNWTCLSVNLIEGSIKIQYSLNYSTSKFVKGLNKNDEIFKYFSQTRGNILWTGYSGYHSTTLTEMRYRK